MLCAQSDYLHYYILPGSWNLAGFCYCYLLDVFLLFIAQFCVNLRRLGMKTSGVTKIPKAAHVALTTVPRLESQYSNLSL